ncbi:formate dehydrogenase accessory sulfurtransferase FdhD [Corynebacterium incognita]|uniref:Sulfur carrier protein FdhD n=1 Tax=Corynebacterium incognita TaxID=2754725 RepID=A0A7G7CMW3_9CORY|nr:formate dehydrogenase accessory sulfurtransferase FdhD [Corynebacterium incognita]QNE88929.1 formate dehydrogenase accessory sulfurtransferase FdhD [Corynebacterium incognita]
MAGRINQTYSVTRVRLDDDGGVTQVDTRADTVTAEEPLEIRVGGQTITTTMRTPGHDIELAHGFLHGEGHISLARDVANARYCAGATGDDGHNTYNLLDVEFAAPERVLSLKDLRLTTTTSACGVCGSTSIDSVFKNSRYPIAPMPLDPAVISKLPDALREQQKQFRKTGGIHAAGAFDAQGNPLVIREDIGRHNAADKVIGHMLLEGQLPANHHFLVMSSRASFELVQKAVMAGFSALVAVSAPSSLAIDLAREAGLGLVGFARDNRFNIYSGELSR